MNIILLPPVIVLYSTHRTTHQGFSRFTGIVEALYEEAVHQGFVSGPLYRIYHGADGKPGTEFSLQIAIPVQDIKKPVKFKIKALAPFKAVTCRHEGSRSTLPASYSRVMEYVDAHRIPIKEEFREVYLNIDHQNPENNITEIQVGIF